MCDVDKLSTKKIKQTEGSFLWRAPLNWLHCLMLLSLLSCSKGASGLVKAFAGLGVEVRFSPRCGTVKHVWGQQSRCWRMGQMENIWRWLSLEGYVHSLSRNHRAYLLRDRESILAEWFHPILAFLCLELGAQKTRRDVVVFLRGNFVKQCYFCWQNCRCSLGFVLVHLLQFLIYLTEMPGINKEKKITHFSEMSCLLEESSVCWQIHCRIAWREQKEEQWRKTGL